MNNNVLNSTQCNVQSKGSVAITSQQDTLALPLPLYSCCQGNKKSSLEEVLRSWGFTCGSLLPSTRSMQKAWCLLSPLQLPIVILQRNKSSVFLTSCQINPFKQQFPLSQPGPLHSTGHPQTSSLFAADHSWSKSQTTALGIPAVQLPTEDTKVPGALDVHAADHFQWSLPSEIHSICYLPTEYLGFNGWKKSVFSNKKLFPGSFPKHFYSETSWGHSLCSLKPVEKYQSLHKWCCQQQRITVAKAI